MSAELRDILDDLARTDDLRAAAGLLRRSAAVLGLSHVAVVADTSRPAALSDAGGEALTGLLGWPPDFISEWTERDYSRGSTAMVRARLEHLPFSRAIDPRSGAPGERALARLGLTCGVTAPVRLPRGRFAIVTWYGALGADAARDIARRDGPDLLLIAHYALEIARRPLDGPEAPEDSALLSARELDCLTLAAKGEPDADAAARLGVTPRTIRFHLANAAEKLGARSRIHAVALAAQLGIVGPIL